MTAKRHRRTGEPRGIGGRLEHVMAFTACISASRSARDLGSTSLKSHSCRLVEKTMLSGTPAEPSSDARRMKLVLSWRMVMRELSFFAVPSLHLVATRPILICHKMAWKSLWSSFLYAASVVHVQLL